MPSELWRMATPYSKFQFGIEAAAQEAARIAGRLIKQGENAYSLIVHSHYIVMIAGIDPLNHKYWMGVDQALMEKCDGLIVVLMMGWSKSKGVAMEIDAFQKMGKRVKYYDPETGAFAPQMLN